MPTLLPAHLEPLPKLQTLYLTKSKVTDAGLRHLTGLESLGCVNLSLTAVTPEGKESLRQALPKCLFPGS